MNIEENKQKFIELYLNKLEYRYGADKLLEYIETETDFFTAPASSRYHLCVPGGLVLHSLNVYKALNLLCGSEYYFETIAICALLHDLCKANYYKQDYRNVKDENGKWQRVPCYIVEDKFPYGHGEKSVYLIQKFMPLLDEEALAIRWHMGYSDGQNIDSASQAFKTSKLALNLHIADLQAAFIDEDNYDNKV